MPAPRPWMLPPLLALSCAGDSGGGASAAASATEASAGSTSTGSTEASAGETSGSTGEATGWTTALKVGVEHGAFLSVWGRSPSEVYAVGAQIEGGVSRGMLFARDAEGWAEVALPAGTPGLNWVAGVGEEIWAVGYEGTALRQEGGAWVSHPTGASTMLWGVWGASPGAIWAVGGDGVSEAPTLLRWDGAAWSEVALPALDPASHGLFKVWGSGADDVMIVGDAGVTLGWDGEAWAAHPSGASIDLISVWGAGGAAKIAVGGRANARIARWDGAAWAGVTLPLPGLNGVWVDEGGAATVVGWQGTIATLAPGSLEPAAEASGTVLLLHAVFGFSGGPRYAVGGSLSGAPPWVGVILESPE